MKNNVGQFVPPILQCSATKTSISRKQAHGWGSSPFLSRVVPKKTRAATSAKCLVFVVLDSQPVRWIKSPACQSGSVRKERIYGLSVCEMHAWNRTEQSFYKNKH
jgi:hypothetical protein